MSKKKIEQLIKENEKIISIQKKRFPKSVNVAVKGKYIFCMGDSICNYMPTSEDIKDFKNDLKRFLDNKDDTLVTTYAHINKIYKVTKNGNIKRID